MSEKDWAKELAKIDKQLESISDDALLPAKPVPANVPPAAQPQARAQAKAEAAAVQAKTTTLGVMARLLLAVALGVGILFWPYAAQCGAGLALYLAAVGAVGIGGIWSAVWSWRHRSGRAHLLSLLLVVWGMLLAARVVLPRVGYTGPGAPAATWNCP
ncbi:MAG TPA: hypothetical protein VEA99_09895 [Gemmatimonadaceae bacterium]|nr:hypothetical protein [Gemmatimonadaceae bacterium]